MIKKLVSKYRKSPETFEISESIESIKLLYMILNLRFFNLRKSQSLVSYYKLDTSETLNLTLTILRKITKKTT